MVLAHPNWLGLCTSYDSMEQIETSLTQKIITEADTQLFHSRHYA